MADESSEMMNLDLNLGPSSSPDADPIQTTTLESDGVNLEDWIEGQRITRLRESARTRTRHRWRSLLRPQSGNHSGIINSDDVLQTGEGSVPLEDRRNDDDDVAKEFEKNEANNVDENENVGKKGDLEKGIGEEGSFFDCNICLDLSSDPVLTCCGHLFCWPCLHQWLNVHSDAKECPVCKGEVTNKNLTPIYGRGSSSNNNSNDSDDKTSLKIPDRPQARRIESWRQTIQRNAFTIPMEEMIRRLGSGFDFSRDFVEIPPQSIESLNESPERNSSLLNRILTSRGMRQEHNNNNNTNVVVPLPDDIVVDIDLPSQNNNNNSSNNVQGDVNARRLASYLRRSHTYRSAPTAELANITQRLIESYLRYTTVDRNQDQPLSVDDRDSISSIAAVIHSESQTLDSAVEIDSTVSLSTSSSRRRIDASRVSDVDSGDSRAHRRRRLN